MTEALRRRRRRARRARTVGAGDGVCVGRPVPGVRVAVSALDADGEPDRAPAHVAGVTGEVLVGAAHVKERYDRLWLTQQESARDAGGTGRATSGTSTTTAGCGSRAGSRTCWSPRTASGTPVGLEQRAQGSRGWCPRRSSGSGRAARSRWSSWCSPRCSRTARSSRSRTWPRRCAERSSARTSPRCSWWSSCRPTSGTTRRSTGRRVAAWAERVLSGERAAAVTRSWSPAPAACSVGRSRERLVADGHDVRTLQRSPSRVTGCARRARGRHRPGRRARRRARPGGRRAPGGQGGRSPDRRREFEAVNVGGTRLLLDEARAAGVRRFVHVSSPSVAHVGPLAGRSRRRTGRPRARPGTVRADARPRPSARARGRRPRRPAR